ncbi:hypothetical protein PEDI_42030 [Persicobacter diffluens]|uniref:Uncharacterized protein n=1 Tax=Persicobacter diffluens TaxID=981 RepID=A0AAN4W0Y6_9BACT|nr:hypothetical protein PEDI_42030 [Persicobacter diffluens]
MVVEDGSIAEELADFFVEITAIFLIYSYSFLPKRMAFNRLFTSSKK